MTAQRLRFRLWASFCLAIAFLVSWTLYIWCYSRPHRVDNAVGIAKRQVHIGEGLPSVCTTLDRLHWQYVNNPTWQFNHQIANSRVIIANPSNQQYDIAVYLGFRNGKLVSIDGAIEDAAF